MGLTEQLPVLDDAARYLMRNLLLVHDADLSAPTPCPEWDLRALLQHVQASLDDVTDVLGIPVSTPKRNSDPVTSLRDAIAEMLLAWRTVSIAQGWCDVWGRQLPVAVLGYVAAIEMTVHGWDIGQACDTTRTVPADLAQSLLTVSPPLAEAGVAGRVFAEPVAVLGVRTPGDRLIALFGRRT